MATALNSGGKDASPAKKTIRIRYAGPIRPHLRLISSGHRPRPCASWPSPRCSGASAPGRLSGGRDDAPAACDCARRSRIHRAWGTGRRPSFSVTSLGWAGFDAQPELARTDRSPGAPTDGRRPLRARPLGRSRGDGRSRCAPKAPRGWLHPRRRECRHCHRPAPRLRRRPREPCCG